MAISIAAEWQMMGDKFYRKQDLYTMKWTNTDLSRHKVACSRFGGPIAIIRDDSKIVQLRSESARPRLSIFSSSGNLISSILWDRPGGRLVALGWTEEENLACIVQDGTIFLYNIYGELLEPHISMGNLLHKEASKSTTFGMEVVYLSLCIYVHTEVYMYEYMVIQYMSACMCKYLYVQVNGSSVYLHKNEDTSTSM